MRRILVVGGDNGFLDGLRDLLSPTEYQLAVADTRRSALDVAEVFRPHVSLIDLAPDMSGFDILRALRGEWPELTCIILTTYSSCPAAVQAMRLGASDYLEKPVLPLVLLDAINTSWGASPDGATRSHPCDSHALERWARVIVQVIHSPRDPRTLQEWAHWVGVSVGGLRNWCLTAHLPGRRSLLFARLLRAVARQRGVSAMPEDLLNVVDRRTLAKMIALGGGCRGELAPNLADFFARQQIISEPKAIAEVQRALNELSSSDVQEARPRRDPFACSDGRALAP
jgi:ActR/RegA family two-component response regulator